MTITIAAVKGLVTIDARVPERNDTVIAPTLVGSSLVTETTPLSAVRPPETTAERTTPTRTQANTLHQRPDTSWRDRVRAFHPFFRSVRRTGTATVNPIHR